MNNVAAPKSRSTTPRPLAELRIALTVERIAVTGIELTEPESQRFAALLTEELKRRLIERFAIGDADIDAETLRFDLSEITLTLDQSADTAQAAREIARRLALTLESAVKKGAPDA